jgi:hypothetical protein
VTHFHVFHFTRVAGADPIRKSMQFRELPDRGNPSKLKSRIASSLFDERSGIGKGRHD